MVDFRLALRHAQHAAIFECFRKFNQKGGAVVPLQTGKTVYFGRACILAIYADQPAAKKCSLTGSACPVCYTPAKHMARAEQEPRHMVLRNEENMRKRKRILTRMGESGTLIFAFIYTFIMLFILLFIIVFINIFIIMFIVVFFMYSSSSGARGAKGKSLKKAKAMGVNLDVNNAWCDDDAEDAHRVFGPDKDKDNVWQCIPQPSLHGMDEGLVLKLNAGVLEALIKEAKRRDSRWDATKVHYIIH